MVREVALEWRRAADEPRGRHHRRRDSHGAVVRIWVGSEEAIGAVACVRRWRVEDGGATPTKASAEHEHGRVARRRPAERLNEAHPHARWIEIRPARIQTVRVRMVVKRNVQCEGFVSGREGAQVGRIGDQVRARREARERLPIDVRCGHLHRTRARSCAIRPAVEPLIARGIRPQEDAMGVGRAGQRRARRLGQVTTHAALARPLEGVAHYGDACAAEHRPRRGRQVGDADLA